MASGLGFGGLGVYLGMWGCGGGGGVGKHTVEEHQVEVLQRPYGKFLRA